jgi:UDP-2-acetamido-3-amino-2,3-dideoxy-glucuronate N-acetyltransferase
MTSLVIGMGEIGSALYSILKDKYKTDGYDIKQANDVGTTYDIVHICIPYSDKFCEIVKDYASLFNPKCVVIHSSVPVGTTKKLGEGYFHSPVRGVHPDMKQGLLTYVKYISYNSDIRAVEKISDYFTDVGIETKVYVNTDHTELMKLLELSRYGVYIAFAKEQEEICKAFGLDYEQVVSEYERTRNDGMVNIGKQELCQPVLYPFKDYVGGHCTVEDMELMLQQIDMPLLREAYRIDRATVAWPNSNIYKTAKIGKGCSIGQFCEIGHNVQIGNNVRIGAFTFIPEGVTIEDDVFIAPRVSFSNDKHPPAGIESWGKVVIKKGAVIGMGAIVLPGVTVGENAVVGAGAIVTKDIPQGHVWYGNPAHDHGKRDDVYKA